MTNILSYFHNFFNLTSNYIYILAAAFVLILFTYGTGIKNNKFISLLFKVGIVGIYLYLFTINFRYLKKLFETNGIFTNPDLSKLRTFLFLFAIFEVVVVLLVMYILYTILF